MGGVGGVREEGGGELGRMGGVGGVREDGRGGVREDGRGGLFKNSQLVLLAFCFQPESLLG